MMLERDDFLDPSNPTDGDQALLELGDPKDAFNLNVDYEVGAVSIGYQLRYIGKQVLFNYEDTYSFQGEPPQNADYADTRFYPSTMYQDIRLGYDINDDVERLPRLRKLHRRGSAVGVDRRDGRWRYL